MKPAFSDYVYQQKDLATLQGKFYNGKRNHVNKFMRAYPDYIYRPLLKSDAEACLKLVESWGEGKAVHDIDNLKESDYIPIKTLFQHFEALELMGGTLWVDNQLVAFSIASPGAVDPTPRMDAEVDQRLKTAIIHIEKADINYRGAYAMINKCVAESACAEYAWLNREEDMGIEGLHKAKQSYGPHHMIDKYEVMVTRQGGL